jgi:hypothetical protein
LTQHFGMNGRPASLPDVSSVPGISSDLTQTASPGRAQTGQTAGGSSAANLDSSTVESD